MTDSILAEVGKRTGYTARGYCGDKRLALQGLARLFAAAAADEPQAPPPLTAAEQFREARA